jgi:Flp pilus assembly protein TadG
MVRNPAALLKRFARETRGNIAVTFALSLTALATAVGGGLDYSRSSGIGTELQAALDSGVLAAASLTQDGSPEEVVRAYVEAALGDHAGLMATLSLQVDSDISFNAREVQARASVTVPTTLLGLAGFNTLTVQREASAIERIRDIEISLVLDISGSMSGSKIRAMREAAEEFVEVVLADNPERTSVSVIPYNGGVRLPEEMNDEIISGNSNQRQRSGCAEYGEDHAIDIDLPRRDLPWLEWRGNEQRDNRSSSFCPERNEASVFLQNDEASLIGLIRDLDAGGNTGLDIATAWGARALDPVWRGRLGGDFADRPAAYDDEDTIKVLVVMTDGAATAQIRSYRQWGRWYNYQLYSAAQARANMSDACDEAKGKGVQIYTIAFQLSGATNRNLMQGCASRPQNYYPVEDMDIAAAFSAIAADISQLRLSR